MTDFEGKHLDDSVPEPGKKRNRGGRPRQEIVRDINFTVRLSADERAKIEAVCGKLGVSGFMRNAALKSASRPVIVHPIARDQWTSLAATTANLNQLTRAVNSGILPDDLSSALAELTDILKSVRMSLLLGPEALQQKSQNEGK